MNKTVISQRLEILEPDYKAILLSNFPNQVAEIIQQQTGVLSDRASVIENGIMLYFLLFIHKYQLIEFLIEECNIPIKNAFRAIEDFIENLPAQIASAQKNAYEQLERPDEIIKEKNRYDLLETFPIYKKYFYLYTKTSGLLQIAQKYNLHNDETYKKFAITVGDIILGFYRTEDTVPLLQQELGLDPRTAALLGADVLDFLAPLSDPNWQPPAEESDDGEAGIDSEMTALERQRTTEFASTDPTVLQTNEATASHSHPPVSLPMSDTGSVHPPHSYTAPVAAYPASTPPTTYQPIGGVSPYTPAPYPPVTEVPQTQSIPSTPPHIPNPTAPLHTFASDMAQVRAVGTPAQPSYPRPVAPSLNLHHEESVYHAQSQDTLRQPLSSVPTYTPTPVAPITPPNPDPPRWSA